MTTKAQPSQETFLAPDVDPDDNPDAHVGAEELDKIEDAVKAANAPMLGTARASTGVPSTLKTYAEITAKLSVPSGDRNNPIPGRLLRSRSIPGGGKLTYIDWQTGIRLLNLHAPGWQYKIHPTEYRTIDGEMSVVKRVSLGIPTSDMGMVWRDGEGIRSSKDKGRGDLQFSAERQALKRAASTFGLALYLYDKD